MQITKTIAIAAMLAALGACAEKNSGGAEAEASLADLESPAAMEKLSEQAAADAMPKADKSTPLGNYVELTSGHQLMFSYLKLAALPIDYNEVASLYSEDYGRASDEFVKNDLLKALRPKIDAAIATAANRRYVRLVIDDPIEKYDFTMGGFPIESGVWGADSTHYFYDNRNYQLNFTNGEAFRYLKVAPEQNAREIEALRSKRQKLRLAIYAYTQAADLSNKVVKAEITKVSLLDSNGNVLAAN